MKAKVYNRHSGGMTHREKFREQELVIPANDYVVMDYEDAVIFKGQYRAPQFKPTGEEDQAGWKMIEIVMVDDGSEPLEKYTCNMDGKTFPTQELLDAYIERNYADKIFKDDALDETIKKRGRPPKDGAHESKTTR